MKKYWKIALMAVLLLGLLSVWFLRGTKTKEMSIGAISSQEDLPSLDELNSSDGANLDSEAGIATDLIDEKKEEGVSEPENASSVSGEIPSAKKELEDASVEEKTATEKASSSDSFKIKEQLVSWGHEKASGRKIDTVVVHSTYNALSGDEFDVEKIIAIYKSYGVAPHYLIDREGRVYQMVKDSDIAYHAGESKTPDGRQNVNGFSLGIEVINSKTDGPTEAQYASLKKLIKSIKDKYSIKYVLGHSDIAPGRKDDPWKFDWGKIK